MTHALTNNYQDCRLINLGSDDAGGGPFCLVQVAYDPHDELATDTLFILRRDGTWIDEMAQSQVTEEPGFEIFFDTSGEAIVLLETLTGPVRLERHTLTTEELRQRLAKLRGTNFEQAAQAMVERYHASRRKP